MKNRYARKHCSNKGLLSYCISYFPSFPLPQTDGRYHTHTRKGNSILPLLSIHLHTEGSESTLSIHQEKQLHREAQSERQFSLFASYHHFSVCHLNTFLFQKLLLFLPMKTTCFFPGNILSSLGISWGIFFVAKIQFSNFTQASFCQP